MKQTYSSKGNAIRAAKALDIDPQRVTFFEKDGKWAWKTKRQVHRKGAVHIMRGLLSKDPEISPSDVYKGVIDAGFTTSMNTVRRQIWEFRRSK
jgi:hypothetical protein